jgi:hypothetical protein
MLLEVKTPITPITWYDSSSLMSNPPSSISIGALHKF